MGESDEQQNVLSLCVPSLDSTMVGLVGDSLRRRPRRELDRHVLVDHSGVSRMDPHYNNGRLLWLHI